MMRTYNCYLTPTTGVGIVASSVYQSSAQTIQYEVGFSLQAVYTGAQPQGTISLLGSNDGIHFVTVSGTSSLLSGSTGSTLWNLPQAYYKFIKANFSATSASSGALTVLMQSKEF